MLVPGTGRIDHQRSCRCRDGDEEINGLTKTGIEINKYGNEDTNKANDVNTKIADDFTVQQISSEGDAVSGFGSARACTHVVCNRFCLSRGFNFGRCVSANICRCYRFRFGLNEMNDISENIVEINRDTDRAKDVNMEKADDFTVGQISSEKISGSDAATGFASARACTNAVCNRFCLSRGYHFGHCVSANICRCYRFRFGLKADGVFSRSEGEITKNNDEDINKAAKEKTEIAADFTVEQISSEDSSDKTSPFVPARACTLVVCNRFCQSRGYNFGHCVSANICRCYRFRFGLNEDVAEITKNDDEDTNKATNGNTEISEDFTVDQMSSDDNSDEVNPFASARACTNAVCNRFCLSRGFNFGRCVSANICRCYRFRFGLNEMNDISENIVEINRDTDRAKDVNMEKADDFTVGQISSEKISGSDAATGFASARACTNAVCNRFCLSRGYHFGRCISANICRCYRFLA